MKSISEEAGGLGALATLGKPLLEDATTSSASLFQEKP